MSADYPNRGDWLRIRDSKRRDPNLRMRPCKPVIRGIRDLFDLPPLTSKAPKVVRGRGPTPHHRKSGPGRRHKQGKSNG